MNAILKDLIGGGIRALLAILWMKHSWPADCNIQPSAYLEQEWRIHKLKIEKEAISSNIWKWLLMSAFVFFVWGILASHINNRQNHPGTMFYVQNAICISACILITGWLMKYLNNRYWGDKLSAHGTFQKMHYADNFSYVEDVESFCTTYKTAVSTWPQWNYDALGSEINHEIMLVMKAHCEAICELTDPQLRFDATRNAENFIGDMVRVARKFGICTTLDVSQAIGAGILAITAQKMLKT